MERIVAENWGVLMSAPVAFVAALGLGMVAGWILVGLIYNQRLTHYQELIANYRDVLDEKLPIRALRPFPVRRTKKMSFGLILIFVGLGAALLGVLIISFEKPKVLSQQTQYECRRRCSSNSHETGSADPFASDSGNANPRREDFYRQNRSRIIGII
jgi:hypothetical protein